MFALINSSLSRAPLDRLAILLLAAERGAHDAARRFRAWRAERRAAAIARRDLSSMSDRELKDIGITRVDVERIACGASDREAP